MTRDFLIEGEFIRLDALMKATGMVSMGGEAKHIIQDGNVLLNGIICVERSKKIRSGDIVEYDNQKIIVK